VLICISKVGYHNEHHDFPSIPWSRLPALYRLAPEFYTHIPYHPSWPMITVNFIRDKEVGLFARAKRIAKGIEAKRVDVPLDGGCADEQPECVYAAGNDLDKEGTRRRR
jgi:sphingolipid 4-desaturase/C4-monooxygenase